MNEKKEVFLSWEELLEKGTLLRETIKRCSMVSGTPYLVTKACSDGTFQTGDIIFLDSGQDIFCPRTGRRVTPGQCRKENMDFSCVPSRTSDIE